MLVLWPELPLSNVGSLVEMYEKARPAPGRMGWQTWTKRMPEKTVYGSGGLRVNSGAKHYSA